jgi:hypothetical protein
MPTWDVTWERGAQRTVARALGLVPLLLVLLCARAYGDVGVVLNESLDTSVARITGSGHSAVYLSRICPESPVRLRLCRPDEEGSVISNYTTLGEDQPFEWNIVPLSVYLYGVEDPRDRPLFGSEKIKHALEERYRENYLSAYCASKLCLTSNKAEWREMVAATISRNVYIFVIKTSVAQDKQLIAELNSAPNENHFNGVTRNCATFTRHIINTYFPGATRPNYINDFGMTSPKAIARSFTRYALHHPESGFRVLHFAQLPGTYKRSSECREGTEQLYHSKKLLVPMLIFAPHELPFATASYVLTGRFNPEHEFEKFPTAEAFDLDREIHAAEHGDEKAHAGEKEAARNQERAGVVGTAKEWKDYHEVFDAAVDQAVREEIIPNRDYLGRFFSRLDEEGTPVLDERGSVWIELSGGGADSLVGVSANNLLAGTSDAELAEQLVLARIDYVLNSSKHSRETLAEFETDWRRLDNAEAKHAEWIAQASRSSGTVIAASASENRSASPKRISGND